jgi:hypothetical protein
MLPRYCRTGRGAAYRRQRALKCICTKEFLKGEIATQGRGVVLVSPKKVESLRATGISNKNEAQSPQF